MRAHLSDKWVTMATAKQNARKRATRRAVRWPVILLGGGALAVGLSWYLRESLMDQALAGTAYGARVGCSCRYLGGRDLKDCEKDFEPGMALIRLSEDDEMKSVTASVPLLASQTATYREGYGCVLQRWDR
jgi:hypothetical protein